ncbi:putative PurR-regulated permease PerM [Mycobacterium sp. OAS707]|uniref:AI-2E family transporter n=1 Tax=Mycobacterium sp. OAS707 TaxID=2663822 RepID=UPI00178A6622|nr:AI-2E family transporter [Mycobacterium sp. OAS707]MBE1552180.1 putative PurR-regulated permease PerM [Mycobacterium sp. OAS707]
MGCSGDDDTGGGEDVPQVGAPGSVPSAAFAHADPCGCLPSARNTSRHGESGSGVSGAMPAWLCQLGVRCAVLLVIAAAVWLMATLALRVAVVSFTLAVAALLAALLSPAVGWLQRLGVPPTLAAVAAIVVLLGVPTGVVLLIWNRIAEQMDDLVPTVTAAVDKLHHYLVAGPLALDSHQIDLLRSNIIDALKRLVPDPAVAAGIAADLLAAMVLAVFTVFFFIKDGESMWRWVLQRVPGDRRDRTDGAGRCAWRTLTKYMVGTTEVALVDAVFIGAGLLVLGVPTWLPLTLLTFVGAYVPLLGAVLAGTLAVLVTLVTQGLTHALIILAVVLAVQQIEGNLLQPVLVGRAVHLHPVVTLVAVTTGTLLAGIPGAVLAVPALAVAYQTAEYLRTQRRSADP